MMNEKMADMGLILIMVAVVTIIPVFAALAFFKSTITIVIIVAWCFVFPIGFGLCMAGTGAHEAEV